jgi:hypothetical protein
MLNMSRRGVLASVAVAACFGLSKRLEFVGLAHAETSLEPTNGVYKYKVGDLATCSGCRQLGLSDACSRL